MRSLEICNQIVFGEGPAQARVMFIGEQPGDSEDKSGYQFVGPAGRLLDELLVEVGIDHSEVYVTNVVKHFNWAAAQRANGAPTSSLAIPRSKLAGRARC